MIPLLEILDWKKSTPAKHPRIVISLDEHRNSKQNIPDCDTVQKKKMICVSS